MTTLNIELFGESILIHRSNRMLFHENNLQLQPIERRLIDSFDKCVVSNLHLM